MYIAHTRNAQGQRHPLDQHLRRVAEQAAHFAASFGGEVLAYYLGLWHDLGKYNPAFQEYLRLCEIDPTARGTGPDHKAAGCQVAHQHLGSLAMLIQGHHGGLPARADHPSWLAAQHATDPASAAAVATARQTLPDLEPVGQLTAPPHIVRDARAAELFLRLLFSALVDADYLDTEQHFQPAQAARRGASVSLADLWTRLEADQRHRFGQASTAVDQVRQAIYQDCLRAATAPPGLFRLTVPTGGGKTRSGLAFALRHALQHGQQRIIVAVPFNNITEQTADTYRQILDPTGADAAQPVVLEHHSGGDVQDGDDFHPAQEWHRLAAENWDAPIIVTTTVQLFESLFANGPGRCRKLHRLARSVIILDEAQTLPAPLLRPILDALHQLCRHYGTTVVFSTATQPAFDVIPAFGAAQLTEIVPNPERYFSDSRLKRVAYEWHTDPALSWAGVAALLANAPQALTILNTRRDALAVLTALADPAALHLSTLLCGAHRRQVIKTVRQHLRAGAPCRLVATQAIEAGVDLDFPLVLRALGPLDSIIQAAGRCNREGRLACGRVIVFRPAAGGLPQGVYRIGTGITGALLGEGPFDPDDPSVARRYFTRLFNTVDTDREDIQELRSRFDYPAVARCFQMIGPSERVVVRYGSANEQRRVAEWIVQLRRGTPDARYILRRLQPYTVALYTQHADKMREQIEPIIPGLGRWRDDYHPTRGLIASGLDAEAAGG